AFARSFLSKSTPDPTKILALMTPKGSGLLRRCQSLTSKHVCPVFPISDRRNERAALNPCRANRTQRPSLDRQRTRPNVERLYDHDFQTSKSRQDPMLPNRHLCTL